MGREVRKKPRDPQGRHQRIYCTLLDSPAWRVLGWSSRALFLDMRSPVNGSNNGNLSATLASLKHRGWKSAATLANALFELQALGFIAQTRGGGVDSGSKVCSLYRFTDLDMFEFHKQGLAPLKATYDYLQFKTVAEAEQALRDAIVKRQAKAERITAKRKEAKARKKTTIQKLKRDDSETEAVKPFIDSETEAEAPATLQKLKQRKGGVNRAETQAVKGNEPNAREDGPSLPTASETEHLYILPSICVEKEPSESAKPDGKHRAPTSKNSEVEEWL